MDWKRANAIIEMSRIAIDNAAKDLERAKELGIVPLNITWRPGDRIAIFVNSYEDFVELSYQDPECSIIAEMPFLESHCEHGTTLLWSNYISKSMGRVQNED